MGGGGVGRERVGHANMIHVQKEIELCISALHISLLAGAGRILRPPKIFVGDVIIAVDRSVSVLGLPPAGGSPPVRPGPGLKNLLCPFSPAANAGTNV